MPTTERQLVAELDEDAPDAVLPRITFQTIQIVRTKVLAEAAIISNPSKFRFILRAVRLFLGGR
jgi:hypothetical protein